MNWTDTKNLGEDIVNFFEHKKIISAKELECQNELKKRYSENKEISEYISHFNSSWIVSDDDREASVHFNKNSFPKFKDPDFWKKFYDILEKAGYTNIRITETGATYCIVADFKND